MLKESSVQDAKAVKKIESQESQTEYFKMQLNAAQKIETFE